MQVETAVVGTGLVVAVGRWAEKKPLTISQFVGVGVLAIGLTILEDIDALFASKFAALIFVAALMYYLVPITKRLGWTKK